MDFWITYPDQRTSYTRDGLAMPSALTFRLLETKRRSANTVQISCFKLLRQYNPDYPAFGDDADGDVYRSNCPGTCLEASVSSFERLSIMKPGPVGGS